MNLLLQGQLSMQLSMQTANLTAASIAYHDLPSAFAAQSCPSNLCLAYRLLRHKIEIAVLPTGLG